MATMREGKPLPKPSQASGQRYTVVPPVPIALKAALYTSFHETGVSQRQFARDLTVAESEVRRTLNPDHSTRTATLDRALCQLGCRVGLTVRKAA